MVVFLQLTIAGADTGPFDIYTDSDEFVTAVQTNVSWNTLTTGFNCTVIPNDATVIRVRSTGDCNNYVDANISGITPPSHLHLGTSIDYESKYQACIEDPNKEYYSANGNVVVGTRIYTDENLTSIYSGDPDRWILLGESCTPTTCSTYYAARVDGDGYIEEAVLCSSLANAHLGDETWFVSIVDCCDHSVTTDTFYSINGWYNVGDTVYTDPACTTPYTANDRYYHKIERESGGSNWYAFRIDGSGIILEMHDCIP